MVEVQIVAVAQLRCSECRLTAVLNPTGGGPRAPVPTARHQQGCPGIDTDLMEWVDVYRLRVNTARTVRLDSGLVVPAGGGRFA